MHGFPVLGYAGLWMRRLQLCRAVGVGGPLHPGSPLRFIAVWPAPLQVIEILSPVLATVTKINKQQGKADHSWLPFVGGPKGDLQAPQGGLLGVEGGRDHSCTAQR